MPRCQTNLLGLPKGTQVGQQGVSVLLVLLPEFDSRRSSEDVLHAQSRSLPHFNAVSQRRNTTLQSEGARTEENHVRQP